MSFIGGIIPGPWTEALGWTLLHSLWQGAAAALALALLLILLRRFSSSSRHVIGVMTMALILCMSVITFLWSYRAEVRGRIVYVQAVPADPMESGPNATALIQKGGFIRGAGLFFSRYFQRHFPLLVTLWLCGLLVYSLRFLGGHAYNQWLKGHQTRPVPGEWQKKCRDILAKMGSAKPVRLLESARIAAPMVIGQIKPAILLPVGLLTGLSGEQVNAILVHELAHIVRRDYLVNLFQSVMEILYFYHPGVRWISSVVRTEREQCCDDLVIGASGESAHLARALVEIQTVGAFRPDSDISLLGRRERMHQRIKRLISRHKLRPDIPEKSAAVCILLASVLVVMTAAGASEEWTTSEIARSQAASGTPAREEPANNLFEMVRDGFVEVIGDAEAGSGDRPEMRSWIIDESNGEVVWRLSPEMVRESPNGISYRRIVSLRKGRYRWFFTKNDVTVLKVLEGGTSPGAGGDDAISPAPAKAFLTNAPASPASRSLDFTVNWKGRLRRIRAVIDGGRVQGFALDNISFLRNDIEKNWDFVVRVLSEQELRQYAYKHPRGGVVDPRKG